MISDTLSQAIADLDFYLALSLSLALQVFQAKAIRSVSAEVRRRRAEKANQFKATMQPYSVSWKVGQKLINDSSFARVLSTDYYGDRTNFVQIQSDSTQSISSQASLEHSGWKLSN